MSKWRSETLPWIVLGSAVALMAAWRVANPPMTPRQNTYASREDCERDYEPAQCRSGGGAHGGYYGPTYSSRRMTYDDPGPGRSAENGSSRVATGSTSVARGGFGGTGHGYGGSYG